MIAGDFSGWASLAVQFLGVLGAKPSPGVAFPQISWKRAFHNGKPRLVKPMSRSAADGRSKRGAHATRQCSHTFRGLDMHPEIPDDEVSAAMEEIMAVPEDQLLALDELIEKLGGVEAAREVLESLRKVA